MKRQSQFSLMFHLSRGHDAIQLPKIGQNYWLINDKDLSGQLHNHQYSIPHVQI